jgi:hypothetical protein
MWNPDEALLGAVFETLESEVAALAKSATGGEAEAHAVLEALGTAVALLRGDEARQHVPESVHARLRDVLAGLSLSELDEASHEMASLAPRCMTLDPEDFAEELLPLLQSLRTRDRIELLWLGAELLGVEESISEEAQLDRDVFDDAAASELWQLIPLGAQRTTELQWMAPEIQERFWWRSRGAAIDANALYDVRRFAEVEDVFPEARPHLDAVRRTYPQAGAARSSAPATTPERSAFLDRLFGESQPPIAPVISLRPRDDERTAVHVGPREGSLLVPEQLALDARKAQVIHLVFSSPPSPRVLAAAADGSPTWDDGASGFEVIASPPVSVRVSERKVEGGSEVLVRVVADKGHDIDLRDASAVVVLDSHGQPLEPIEEERMKLYCAMSFAGTGRFEIRLPSLDLSCVIEVERPIA